MVSPGSDHRRVGLELIRVATNVLDGLIILWVPSEAPTTNFGDDSPEEVGDKEYWRDKRAIKWVDSSRF